MRVKANLTELKEVDPRYVSLVKRAANRIPFRIQKCEKEQDMSGGIDLSSIKRVLKTADKAPTPVLSGIVVVKGSNEQFAAVTKAVADAGYKTADVGDMGDGVVMFKQDDSPTDGGTVVRLSDATVVVLKGFDAASKKLASDGDYDDGMRGSDYHQGVAVATAAYNKAMGALLQKGDVAGLEALAKKFNGYVSTLTSSIPAPVFKLDGEITALVAAHKMDDGDGKDPEAASESEEDKKKREDAEAAQKTADAEAAAKAADPKKDELKDPACKSDSDKVLEAVASLVSKVDMLTAQVKEVASKQETAESVAKEAAAKADKLAAAMKGYIPGDSNDGDRTPIVKKETKVPDDMIIDTALQGRAKKYEHIPSLTQ